MRASVIFVAMAVASASAQTNYTSELDMTIDPNTVDQSDRATWCQAQTNTCAILCDNNPEVNGCTEATLKWNCTCASNSSSPGIQFYQQTVPYFICEALFSQCISQNAGTVNGQDTCNNNIKPLCAKNVPPKNPVSDGSSQTSGTATATSEPTTSASGTGAAVTTTKSKGLANPTMAPVGSGAFVAAMGLMAYML